ncbi:universal stress protein UspA [Desulfolithobacter dissulfuricans]|uniref:Universal stress protein UspA n=1 Tax=Desulfolithobacter dissulfuricans TaxID=2795293 RepID=A0A915TYC2_9BACT|nr:universal stress protein [Desulfolithobacter dissulfuricans]BCO08039.1 universal stress protein UspA [Desulfolithobacter dissulfuricans]
MFKHILLATDGSESVRKAEDYALYLSRACGADLTVLHVLDDSLCHYGHVDQLVPSETKDGFVSYVISEREAAAREVIREFSRKAASQDVKYSFKLKQGIPAKEIAVVADKEKVDLIVMGGRHPARRPRFRVATTADKVAAQSRCSIMTLI